MEIVVSIVSSIGSVTSLTVLTSVKALQAVLVSIALCITLLRFWVRLCLEQRGLTISDYCTWIGWLFTLGYFICAVISLRLAIDYPVDHETGASNSQEYLKVRSAGCICISLLDFPAHLLGTYRPSLRHLIYSTSDCIGPKLPFSHFIGA